MAPETTDLCSLTCRKGSLARLVRILQHWRETMYVRARHSSSELVLTKHQEEVATDSAEGEGEIEAEY
jgi:hypothetical protein